MKKYETKNDNNNFLIFLSATFESRINYKH